MTYNIKKSKPKAEKESYNLKKGNAINVGELGGAMIVDNNDKKAITAYYVEEEDGTKSWQLNPDYYSDRIIKSAKVRPLEYKINKNGELE
jgi:hypothetical protein